ncbi:hypothetical protein GGS21DRAFT_490870 [Xylaria nigripes]|nr:hypothetical protein GGS21DRAFT_490870 [Xylaria nigripes]
MKSFTAIACQVAALAASVSAQVPTGPFSIAAYKAQIPGDDVFFLLSPINAGKGKFFINQGPNTYCPTGVDGLDCTHFVGTATNLLQGDGSSTLALEVSTPGGQQVYLAPDGSLSYTAGHSAILPEGSTLEGFSKEITSAEGNPISLQLLNKKFYLCPVSNGSVTRTDISQLFAAAEPLPNCVNIDVRVLNAAIGQVWQFA